MYTTIPQAWAAVKCCNERSFIAASRGSLSFHASAVGSAGQENVGCYKNIARSAIADVDIPSVQLLEGLLVVHALPDLK